MSHPRNAFTLVELLVVIGIIALLISILLPALSRARESAKTIVCASQLRSYGMFVQMYTNENNGWLPCGFSLIGSSSYNADGLPGWLATLGRATTGNLAEDEKQLAASKMISCPTAIAFGINTGRTYSHNRQIWWSYEQTIKGKPESQWLIHKMKHIKSASETVILADAQSMVVYADGRVYVNAGFVDGMPWWPPFFAHGGESDVIDNGGGRFWRPKGSGNFMFADGHVETLKADLTGLSSSGVAPMMRPALNVRFPWDRFWNGK